MAADTNKIKSLLITVGGLFGAIMMGIYAMTNPAGGIVALVPLITALISLLALVSPRQGIFALAALVIWVDEFKRIAVYYGGAYSFTVVQTLAMPFIVLAALNVGFFASLLYGRVRMDKIGYLIYAAAAFIGFAIFFTTSDGLMAKGQRAANIAGYITLIPIAYTYFRNFEDWRKFFAFQVLVAFIPASWAIWQYYFGFNTLELEYARSGLSMVHYIQMFSLENPRAFGLFGSSAALGCASIYGCFATWHAFRYKRFRLLWFPVAFGYLWAIVASEQRTILVYPIFVLVGLIGFRWLSTTLALYAGGIAVVILGIYSSTWMLDEGLDKINDAIASESDWGKEVLNVYTFGPRLLGWENLKNPETWSLFGKTDELRVTDQAGVMKYHDAVNVILEKFGAAGLLAILIPAIILLIILHRIPLTQPDKQLRNDTAASLALALPMMALSFLAGDNFNTNPINLQIWSSFIGVLVVRRNMIAAKAEAKRAPIERPKETEQTPINSANRRFQHS